MVSEDSKESGDDPNSQPLDSNGGIFSPRFKSLAAMAGWDEEALLLASLVVDDTPEREFKSKKRFLFHNKNTPTSSRRKRRSQRGILDSIPVTVLDLGDDENSVKEIEEKKAEATMKQQISGSSSSSRVPPCMDKLREELSCAICLELCFEPSTTSCGHSFCKKCLRSAADRCGRRCPKCRQLISNGRSCTVNTVLWNTIQLLFPQETEARKTGGAAINGGEARNESSERAFFNNLQNQNNSRESRLRRRRRPPAQEEEAAESVQRLERETMPWMRIPIQDEDAALALRVQREEFMPWMRIPQEHVSTTSLSLARANLRAMAARAVSVRIRSRHL